MVTMKLGNFTVTPAHNALTAASQGKLILCQNTSLHFQPKHVSQTFEKKTVIRANSITIITRGTMICSSRKLITIEIHETDSHGMFCRR